MAIEAKAAVAVDSITGELATEIFELFGLECVGVPTRIYGGYASSNFRAVGRQRGEETTRTFLLKINHYSISIEDSEHQLHVLDHLRTVGFPTNYPHADPCGRFLVEHAERRAMLLDFMPGVAGDKVLGADEAKAPSVLGELASALARLHQVTWPAERTLRDIRCGYPVCNTGDLLRGDEVCALEADPRFATHEFVTYVRSRLSWFRQLYDREDVPWGLIHGDGFLDNTLYQDDAEGGCRLSALVDWEDSCVGPYALDLAVCASACCFTASNELLASRLGLLLRAYEAQRPLATAERASFADFMEAGALACGFYRFCEFNVRQLDASDQAKDSYKIMFDRARRLETGEAREIVAAALAA